MPRYKRLGKEILDEEGFTVGSNIALRNASHIEIAAGNSGRNFRLKFSSGGNDVGWWVDQPSLTQLITELMYIKREVDTHWKPQEEERGLDEDPPF